MASDDLSGLYEQSGGDPDACELCGEDFGDGRDWMRGLDGAGAHVACLEDAGIWNRLPREDDHA